jgi:AAA+ superfamily predicted ATPase
VIAIRGPRESGRTSLARVIAASLDKTAIELDVATPIEIVVRETRWSNAVPVFAGIPGHLAAIAWHCSHVITILEPTQRLPLDVASRGYEIVTHSLERDTREALWKRELGELGELTSVTRLYGFGPSRIQTAAAMAKRAARNKQLTREHLLAACQAVTQAVTFDLATLLVADVTMDDLVLAPVARRELDLAIAWSRHRPDEKRPGLACLFAGPSGTGKTMAARAVAHAVGLPIYRIDLAQVVNKYIGETEKNLGRLFDEARATSSILFFDEADTLFAKRTEVRDAHDRFANLETGYLLQRLEDHTGIVLLATNLRGNFDQAFARRLQIVVDFAPPGPRERALLWQRMLPRERGAIDVDLLASRFTLTGGDIRNTVATSLVLADVDRSQVEMRHVIIATWRQLQRSGRLASGDEFADWQRELAPWLAQRSES